MGNNKMGPEYRNPDKEGKIPDGHRSAEANLLPRMAVETPGRAVRKKLYVNAL
jgi:hypothetical protein